jgi:hypothetical protein
MALGDWLATREHAPVSRLTAAKNSLAAPATVCRSRSKPSDKGAMIAQAPPANQRDKRHIPNKTHSKH